MVLLYSEATYRPFLKVRVGMVLGYFSALPYSLDIEPLDARGAAACIYVK